MKTKSHHPQPLLADYSLILQELKKHLKTHRITQSELSLRSGIPLSTIKKIFSGQDCSMQRMMHITECLGINFITFLSTLHSTQAEDVFSLPLAQEEFFARNLDYFLFFHKIFRDFYTLRECQEKLQLSDRKYWQILRKLEEFKLLQVLPGDKVKFLVAGGLQYLPEGKLQDVILGLLAKNFTEFLLNPKHEKILKDKNSTGELNAFMRVYFGKMSTPSYKRLLAQLKELHLDFIQTCIKDRKVHSMEDLIDVSWNFGLADINAMNFLIRPSE